MNVYINVSSISSVIERANKVRELIDVCMDSRVRPGSSTRAYDSFEFRVIGLTRCLWALNLVDSVGSAVG